MANLTDMLSKFVTANTASTSGSGTLPGNTITNPKEDLKGITTRSGVTPSKDRKALIMTRGDKGLDASCLYRKHEDVNLLLFKFRTRTANQILRRNHFLEGDDMLPVIIAKDLKDEEKAALLKVLKSHKRAIAWKLSDIKGVSPEFCTHKILMEEDFEPSVQAREG
ncbi:hypothetical protein Tco_0523537 [Tanacetum coccineum]